MKYFCSICDAYLTFDSEKGRRQQCVLALQPPVLSPRARLARRCRAPPPPATHRTRACCRHRSNWGFKHRDCYKQWYSQFLGQEHLLATPGLTAAQLLAPGAE